MEDRNGYCWTVFHRTAYQPESVREHRWERAQLVHGPGGHRRAGVQVRIRPRYDRSACSAGIHRDAIQGQGTTGDAGEMRHTISRN